MKFEILMYCIHCGTNYENIDDVKECCNGEGEFIFQCIECQKTFISFIKEIFYHKCEK